MSEFIDREEALNCFHSWLDKRGDMHTPDEMEEYNAIEALTAIEVVRCKDCKFFVSDMEWCEADDEHPASPDAFCSWAERRDG